MLTEEGYRERKWGPFPALRKVLETRRLPDSYFGWTSVSDNMFDQLQRTVEISLLACECELDLRNTAQTGGSNDLINDLVRLSQQLQAARSLIDDASRRLERLCAVL